jgi:hypothetical protein
MSQRSGAERRETHLESLDFGNLETISDDARVQSF